MIWDPVADALLVTLWDEGGSLAYVADGMIKAGYTEVTRNSIAGRKHRLMALKATTFRRLANSYANQSINPRKPIPRHHQGSNIMNDSTPPKVLPKAPPTVEDIKHWNGVEYLSLPPHGCKAVLERRGGDWGLPMLCGRLRCCDYDGRPTSYCETHYRLHTNPPSARKHHG